MSEDNLEVVSQAMMDQMEEFCRDNTPFELFNKDLRSRIFFEYPQLINYIDRNMSNEKAQLKVIKHMWLNEPQFKAEKPKKWIVRMKETDRDNDYWYLSKNSWGFYNLSCIYQNEAHKFETKEEAVKWATPQTEVMEVEG